MNKPVDISKVGFNYVIAPKMVYVSVIKSPVRTHGTYQVYPLPMYFYGIINYPSFNTLWPATAQGEQPALNGYQLLQKTK